MKSKTYTQRLEALEREARAIGQAEALNQPVRSRKRRWHRDAHGIAQELNEVAQRLQRLLDLSDEYGLTDF